MAESQSTDTGPITQAEMIEMFGTAMPIEAVQLVFSKENDGKTVGEIRAELRKLARDWAQKAADAVLDNLMDRRDIKRPLQDVEHEDAETWAEIRKTLADIIRSHAP